MLEAALVPQNGGMGASQSPTFVATLVFNLASHQVPGGDAYGLGGGAMYVYILM